MTKEGNTLRTYGMELIHRNDRLHEFSYNMLHSKKYRRALLLLNRENIDEADERQEIIEGL